jgi:hypothetical protein
MKLFQRCLDTKETDFQEFSSAKAELNALQADDRAGKQAAE